MVPNQLWLKLTYVCIGISHILSIFLELLFSEGVKQFLGLLNQPPTPLITLIIIGPLNEGSEAGVREKDESPMGRLLLACTFAWYLCRGCLR